MFIYIFILVIWCGELLVRFFAKMQIFESYFSIKMHNKIVPESYKLNIKTTHLSCLCHNLNFEEISPAWGFKVEGSFRAAH